MFERKITYRLQYTYFDTYRQVKNKPYMAMFAGGCPIRASNLIHRLPTY